MTINTISYLPDTLLWIKDTISGNITDPGLSSGTRPGNSRFVVMSHPDRPYATPMISVGPGAGMALDRLGMQTDNANILIPFEVRIWSHSTLQRDQLAGSVVNVLRQSQISAFANGSSAVDQNLVDLNITNMFVINEPNDATKGKVGTTSQLIEGDYTFITTD